MSISYLSGYAKVGAALGLRRASLMYFDLGTIDYRDGQQPALRLVQPQGVRLCRVVRPAAHR